MIADFGFTFPEYDSTIAIVEDNRNLLIQIRAPLQTKGIITITESQDQPNTPTSLGRWEILGVTPDGKNAFVIRKS